MTMIILGILVQLVSMVIAHRLLRYAFDVSRDTSVVSAIVDVFTQSEYSAESAQLDREVQQLRDRAPLDVASIVVARDYAREAWAEIAAMHIGEPLDEELRATDVWREPPLDAHVAIAAQFGTFSLGRPIAWGASSTGFLRDSVAAQRTPHRIELHDTRSRSGCVTTSLIVSKPRGNSGESV